jgi:hypothetical protein
MCQEVSCLAKPQALEGWVAGRDVGIWSRADVYLERSGGWGVEERERMKLWW